MRKKTKHFVLFTLILSLILSMSLMDVNAATKKPAAVKRSSIKVSKSTSTTKSATLTIKWKKAKRAKKYLVAYKVKGAKKYKKVKTKKKTITLKNLKGSKKYVVKIQSQNGKKHSKYSKAKTFTTKKLVTPLKLNQSSVTLYEKYKDDKDLGTVTLKVTGVSENKLSWKSGNTSIATVKDGVITPVAAGETDITVSGQGQTAKCHVVVKSGEYKYITAEDLLKELASGNTSYQLIDVRQNVDKSGMEMGSYTNAHIVGAISAPVMSDEYDYLSVSDATSNIKNAGVSNISGKKYVFICYYGGEIAELGVKYARTVLGINDDNIYILKGGQWALDPEWSFMSDAPYDAPEYLIGLGTLSDGTAVQTVTASQLKTAVSDDIKIYNVLDVRTAEEYNSGHIDGAVSAPVKADNANALKTAVNKAEKNAIFVIADQNNGEDAASAYQKMISYGVSANRIVVLEGGMDEYTK